jgi:hypothetical protein
MCIYSWFYIFLYNITMYTSGKHGSSSIYVLTDLKKNKKKHTQKVFCYAKNIFRKKRLK